MRKRGRRALALARRYGHFSMKSIEDATTSMRKLARENPEVTAAALGASAAALAAGMGTGTAAMLGAVAGVAVEKVTTR